MSEEPKTKIAEERFLTREDLAERGVKFCPSHLRRLIATQGFPAPVRLGTRKCFWRESQVNAWLADRLENQPPAPNPDREKAKAAGKASVAARRAKKNTR